MIRYIKRLRRAIQIRGGLISMTKKARNIYASEGFGGVALRLYGLLRNSGYDQAEFTYAKWYGEFEANDSRAIEKLIDHSKDWALQPLISVILPVHDPNPEWLAQAIESVRQQIYPHWELCIADDASTRADVLDVIARYENTDARIRVVWRTQNGHISVATNSAIEISHGEYLAMLDHDDLLSPTALYWVVEALQVSPESVLVYTDEDKISEQGERHTPYFKCDINPDLLLSQNMVTHLAVYRADVVKSLGGCRVGFEGSQDYDLTLRVIDASSIDRVLHVPRVLYHWRMHSQSTASGHEAKPYALMAAKRAIEEHLFRCQIKAEVEAQAANGVCSVRYAVPEPAPLVSIIIPTRNSHGLVKKCIESIRERTDYRNYEILLVDNGSDDARALAYFQELSDFGVRLIRDDRPFNYSALNNAAVEQAIGDVLVLMNNDIEVISPQWLTEMVSHACRSGVGAVGAKLLYPTERIQHAGVVLGIGECAGHAHRGFPAAHWGYFSRASVTQNFSAVTGACLAVQRRHFLSVGGLNEVDLTVAFNDIDFCLKLVSAGLRTVFTPHALLYHHESASRGLEDNPEKIARFTREVAYLRDHWRSLIHHDPFYSPNLTLAHEGMTFAFPPRVSRWPRGIRFDFSTSVGIVIPTLNAGPAWDLLLDSIGQQRGVQAKVLVIDSGSTDHTVSRARAAGCSVVVIPRGEFSHGGTRQIAVEMLDCEFLVFLTQDATLASPDSLSSLLFAFDDPRVAIAHGRQLPRPSATLSARVLREFNYPATPWVRSFEDRHSLGLRAAFTSNSFAAYRRAALLEVGGFDPDVPVGEDVLACAALLKKGYCSAYVASAYVVHSHNYSLTEEFERYKAIGRMHAMRPHLLDIFGRPESEGIKLVKAELKEAIRIAPWLTLSSLTRATVKYVGYRQGLASSP